MEPVIALLSLDKTWRQSKELTIVKMKIIQTEDTEGAELGVELVHLCLSEERSELVRPLEVSGEHDTGVQTGHQAQVGAQQHTLVTLIQSRELLVTQVIMCDQIFGRYYLSLGDKSMAT